jgi:2'-hydroxyisoflavone reductase
MNILVLGGTVFLGRALVEAGLARGHTLTMFNRGISTPGLFPTVEQIHGDRERDLHLLDGRSWDAVVDTCGYFPRVVQISAQALAGRVGIYCFVSSLSVYAGSRSPGVDEQGELAQLADETVEEITGGTYGGLKVLCEREVQRAFGDRAWLVRPGLIVGQHDRSDRFTYWPWRLAQGGKVLAPGRPEREVQFIDVRNLAEWMLLGLERGLTGIHNANGAPGMCSMGSLLEGCRLICGREAELIWAADEFLLAEKVNPWIEMPLWIPESDPDAAGFFAFSTRKALEDGLVIRPVEESIRAVLDWLPERGERPWRAGMTRERESGLLDKLSR